MLTQNDSSAIHEAGHAVLAVVFERQIFSVSLLHDQYGDGVVNRAKRCRNSIEAAEEIAISFAGGAAADNYDCQTDTHYDDAVISLILKAHFPECKHESLKTDICQVVAGEIGCFECAILAFVKAIREPRELSGEQATTIIKENLPTKSDIVRKIHALLDESSGEERLTRTPTCT
jgi:hypothetical protein